MRFWHVLLVVTLSLLASGGWTQGLQWNQPLDKDRATMTRASNGDIYVAGLAITPEIVPIVSCYSAAGVLKFRFVSGNIYFASSAKIHSARLFGSNLYFVVVFGDQFSRVFKFDIDAQTLTSSLPQSAGSMLILSDFSLTLGNYCLVGRRVSDDANIIQVRSQTDNSLQREVVSSYSLSEVFTRQTYHYVIGTYNNSGQYRVVVYQVSASSGTSRTAIAPNISSNFLTTPLKGVLTSAGTLFLMSNYYNGVSTFNLFVIPFNTSTLTFANSWEESAAATESYLNTCTALGSDSVFLALHDRHLGISNTGSLVFELPHNYNPGVATLGTAVTDAEGNAACLLTWSSGSWLYRINPAGQLLNRTPIATVPGALGEAVIDSAGVVRFLYQLNSVASDWYLAAATQASLHLPGPYTIGGNNLVGTINLGGPAPTGGATFELFSNNSAATVPTTMTIPEGQTSANFTITTTPVAANAKPTINARYNGLVLQSNFDLAAPLIQNVTATPQSQYGGVNIAGNVQLTGPAPTGGKTVSLTSSNPARATIPASVSVPAGATSVGFTITTFPTLVNASSVITATTGTVSKTRFIAIVAPVLQTATLASTSIQGGASTTITVTLGSPAPTGYTVTLLSGAPSLVQLPSSYSVPAGATTVNVPVLSSPVTSTIPITLVAYRGPYIKVMTLTLTP